MRCCCIIAPSGYVIKRVEELCHKEIALLPTGIDMKKFEQGNGEKIRKHYKNKKIILHVGRIVKEKNIDVLIDAAPEVLKKIDGVFIIVGEGPARKILEEKVKNKNLHEKFVFTGFVEDNELADYYKAGDVFAFPSTYETQGIVAFEAMVNNTKKPIISTAWNLENLKDIVEMAEVVAGGSEVLRHNPFVALYGEPISPLQIASEAAQKLLYMASKGLLERFDNLLIEFHRKAVPHARKRVRDIRAQLSRTHHLTWKYEWFFENWKRNS